jgi:hypothetical protein
VGYWRFSGTDPIPSFSTIATNLGSFGAPENGVYGGDLAGRGATGAVAGDTATSFDGVTEFVDVPYLAALNPTNAFSVEGWLAPGLVSTNIPGGLACAVACGDFSNPRGGWLIYEAATGWNLRMYYKNGLATSVNIIGLTNLTAGTYYHVAATWDGTTAMIYVNGVFLNSANPATTPKYVPGQAGDFTVGVRSDRGIPWKGTADEVAFYTNTLSASQIAAHYAAATTNAAGYAAQILADHPVLYYRLDEIALPRTANSGSLGSSKNGILIYPATSDVAGPESPTFPGFESTNVGLSFSGAAGSKGTGGYVSIPSLNLNTNAVTITCWVNPTGSQAGSAGVVMHRARVGSPTLGTSAGLIFDQGGGLNLSYNWDGDNATYSWASGVGINASAWNFVALIIQPDKAILFAPGSDPFPATNLHTHAVLPFEGTTYVGTDAAANGFNGAIDEVAIFNRSLSVGETYSQYSAAVGTNPPAVFFDPQAPPSALYAGDSLMLFVDAGGTPNIGYQWRKGGGAIGVSTSSYTIPVLATSDTGSYDVVITNAYGSVTSAVASVTVAGMVTPVIAQDILATNRSLYLGGSIKLKIAASGGGLTYQWTKNGTVIPGETNPALTIAGLVATNAGNYACTVTNTAGSTNSATAFISIAAPGAGTYEAVVSADSPLSWYRLDDAPGSTLMLDAMGNNDGFWTNSGSPVTLGSTGALTNNSNKAATFNAANQSWGEIPLPPPTTTGDFTFELWVRTSDLTTDFCPLSTFRPKYGFWFEKDTGGNWRGRDGYGEEDGNSSRQALIGSVTAGQWTYLAAEFSSSTGHRVFINGRWDGNSYIDFCRNRNTPMRIGALDPLALSGLQTFFTGDIDEVAIYNTALTTNQVLNHYLTGIYSSVSPPLFKVQPQPQTVPIGSTATFPTLIEGSPTIGQQWFKNGVAISNATNMTLTIPNATYSDAIGASYRCVATNGVGSVTSIVATLTVLPQPTFAYVTNNLVLHMKFDGDYTDSSGHGHNGTPVGSPSFAAGVVGSGSLHYSTTTSGGNGHGGTVTDSNYVTLGVFSTNSDLWFSNNVSFSVAYWVRTTTNGYSSGDLPIFSSSVGSFHDGATAFVGLDFAPTYNSSTAGGWSWSLADGATAVGVYGPANSINTSNWHHLVHTFDRAAGQATTYLDGLAVSTAGISILNNIDSGNPFNIGQDPTGAYNETGEYFVDDLAVWRRILTPTEAYAIYYAGITYGRSFDTTAPITMILVKIGSDYWIVWQAATLYQADNVAGPYTIVPGATAPYYKIPLGGPMKYYRVR